jgi:PAS domain S-box-containing protein
MAEVSIDGLAQELAETAVLLEALSDAVVCIDAAGTIVMVNEAAADLFGYGAKALTGRLFDGLLHSTDRRAYAHDFRQFTETPDVRQRVTGETLTAVRADGAEIPVEISLARLATSSGMLVVAIVRDPGLRSAMACAAREAAERLRLSLEGADLGSWHWDAHSGKLEVNERWLTMLGLDVPTTVPTIDLWHSLVHPEDMPVLERLITDVINRPDGYRFSVEIRARHSDGHYVWILDKGAVFARDAEGRPLRIVGTHMDITDRVTLEEQLQQARRLEAVGKLTGGIAHDFNNLLTVILGNAEWLLQGAAQDPARLEQARMIVEAARKAGELTKRLLAFARKQPLSPEAVNCNHLLREMVPLLRRTLGEHIDIDLRGGDEVLAVSADVAQLENALLNLCINARDAMADGGRLTLETGLVDLDAAQAATLVDVQPGQYVLIAVTDTGCGIAPDVLHRVFEPFYTTKEAGQGTGLGLAMVYGFIRQSGGHVSLSSEPGRGTTVRMYLPREGRHAVAPAAADTSALPMVPGKETVLVVEDDEPVRRLAVSQLRELGYTVLEASNGVEALEIIERGAGIQLLFSDVVMPGGMNGWQLAGTARQRLPDLRVLLTSGYTEHQQVLLDEGADAQRLRKPYGRAELAQHVRATLDDAGS